MSNADELVSSAKQHSEAGRPAEAEAALRSALAQSPTDAEANRDLGMLLFSRGEVAGAIPHLRRAVETAPSKPGFWYELAMVLACADEFREALEALDRSLALAPGAFQSYLLKAQVCLRTSEPQRAVEAADQGLGIAPDNPDLMYTGALALKAMGMVDESAQVAEQLAAAHLDNPDYLLLAAWQATYSRLGEPIGIRNVLERRGRLLTPPGSADIRLPNSPNPDRRLRVGFLCQDIRRDSPIARFIAAPLLHLNQWEFEVRGYLTEPTYAHMTERLKHAVDGPGGGWVDVSGMNDDALLARIRADGIDIIVDVAGNTMGHRQSVLARRAAPVQVTCIGDPRTTGNPAMDYRVVDDFTDPSSNPDSDRYCTERLARLPRCFLCYEPHDDAGPFRPPIDPTRGPVTFGSFNVADKTGPSVVELWAKILGRVEGSRLLLKAASYRPAGVRERYLALFQGHGVDPSRVEILAEYSTMPEHFRTYSRIDIALDTFPYAGTTTTCDALWAGVPVVTLAGSWHVARVGVSLMNAVGLPELVGRDPEHYVQIAADLAADRVRLADLHRTLRQRMAGSVLLDAPAYGKRLGDAYRAMWREWCVKAIR
jgi:protein O-GlcNAc transferase